MNEYWAGKAPYYGKVQQPWTKETEAEKLARLKRWAEEAYESLQGAAKAYQDASTAHSKALKASEAECTCCPKHRVEA